jgi:hypothetical protein
MIMLLITCVVLLSLSLFPARQNIETVTYIPEHGVFKPDCSESKPFIESELRVQAAQRDLSRYERLGPLCVSGVPTFREDAESKVRRFLWEHWVEKRPGYVIATFHTVEGKPGTSLIFVGPDGEGAWRIEVRYQRTVSSRRGISTPDDPIKRSRESGGYVVHNVRRAPANKERALVALRFYDGRGRLITAF